MKILAAVGLAMSLIYLFFAVRLALGVRDLIRKKP